MGKRANYNGFTLIELLTVILIIGMIVGFALVTGSASRARARDDARINDLKRIEQALDLYRLEVDRSGDSSLYAYPWRYLSGNTLTGNGIYPLAGERFKEYLATTPSDPFYKKQYHYYAPGCVRPGAGSLDSPAVVSPGKDANFHTLAEIHSGAFCPTGSGWVPYLLYALLEHPITGAARQSVLSNAAKNSDRAIIYTPSQPLFSSSSTGTYQTIANFSFCYPVSRSVCPNGYETNAN